MPNCVSNIPRVLTLFYIKPLNSIFICGTVIQLARACALSFGEHELSLARWEHLKALEDKRQARLRVV